MNPPRSRTQLKDVLLLLCSIGVSLLLGEAGARLFLRGSTHINPHAEVLGHLHVADPMLGWVLSSSPVQFRHRLADSAGKVQYDVVYSVSGQQRRTSEDPPDAPVLIAAGCSFTFGHGLPDQDTWPWLLQERLPDYHVVNIGTMAYGTDQALLAAERQIMKSPQRVSAVVVGLGDFQIERNRGPQGWLASVYPYSKPLYGLGSDGPQYRRQVQFWNWGALARHSELVGHLANKAANLYYRIPSHHEARDITLGLLTAFAQRMASRGIRLAVVMLPYVGDNSPEALTDQKVMVDGLRSSKIPVLTPQYPRLRNGAFDMSAFILTPLDRHPNRQYNVVLTSQLKPFLESSGVVATRSAAAESAGALAKLDSTARGK